MYKTSAELKKANPEIYKKILETYKAFYDKGTGYRALIHPVREALRTELSELFHNNTERICNRCRMDTRDAERKQLELIYFGVFRVIYDLEQNGTISKNSLTLNDTEKNALTTAIIEKTKQVLNGITEFLNNPNPVSKSFYQNVSKKTSLADDEMRFAFTPEQIQKYNYGYGCHHFAMGFINTNQSLPLKDKIPKEDIKLILTTRWDHLHDGKDGHVVPCIKMEDGFYYAFEPQILPQKSKIQFIIPGYSENVKGQAIFHLLRHGKGNPYMITTDLISLDDYMKYFGNHEDFIKKYSTVKKKEAKSFLERQITIGNLTQDQVNAALKEFNNYQKDKLKSATQTVTAKRPRIHVSVPEKTLGK